MTCVQQQHWTRRIPLRFRGSCRPRQDRQPNQVGPPTSLAAAATAEIRLAVAAATAAEGVAVAEVAEVAADEVARPTRTVAGWSWPPS